MGIENYIIELQIVHLIIWIIVGILSSITLTSAIIYACSKYYYRPYKRLPLKDLLTEYCRAETISINWPDEKTTREIGEIATELAYKRAHDAHEKAFQIVTAFTIEYNEGEDYIQEFCPLKVDKKSVDKYYNEYIEKHGTAVESPIEYKICKYIAAFLQRKKSTVYMYYFNNEIFSPTK